MARQGVHASSAVHLTEAAVHGKVEVMRYLVNDLGADVNQADDEGFTPLYSAAQEGHVAAVRCLVNELGADVDLANQAGATPLYLACQLGHLALVRCLVEELGANVNLPNQQGTTPLIIAAQEGQLAVVRCLVEELGADVNQKTKDGVTALMVAATMDNHKLVAYLMRHGADPTLSAPVFGTAADISKCAGAPDEHTAYLDAKTHCSNTTCSGAGLKKCTGCKQARYCGKQCQLAHWPTHKDECKEAAKNKSARRD
jgi:hypothetical protein